MTLRLNLLSFLTRPLGHPNRQVRARRGGIERCVERLIKRDQRKSGRVALGTHLVGWAPGLQGVLSPPGSAQPLQPTGPGAPAEAALGQDERAALEAEAAKAK